MPPAAPQRWQHRRTQVVYRAGFASPQFGLLASVPRTLGALQTRLAAWGADVGGLRVDGSMANPSTFRISCSLTTVNVAVAVTLSTIEVDFESFGTASPFHAIVAGTIDAVLNAAAPNAAAISEQEITWVGHGELVGQDTPSFLNRYVRNTPFPESEKAGVALAFGIGPDDATGRRRGVIMVAPSLLYQGGLALTAQGAYDGTVELRTVETRWAEWIKVAAKRFGLDIAKAEQT